MSGSARCGRAMRSGAPTWPRRRPHGSASSAPGGSSPASGWRHRRRGMDPTLINALVSALGPLVIPILSAVATWLTNWILGKVAPGTQAVVNPVLPAVAAGSGMALGSLTGMSPLSGLVLGLAGTGLHQLGHQILKAAHGTKR